MKITITVNKHEVDNLRGFANIKFDESYALENVKIKESQNGLLYVEMPRYKRTGRDGETEYRDVFHPISADMRKAFNEAIMSAYSQANDKAKVFAFEYGSEPLVVSRVSTHLYEKDALKAFSNVVFKQGFALENAKVKHSSQSGNLFIDLPKYKNAAKDESGNLQKDENGDTLYAYRDCFHPISKDAYNTLSSAIIEAYEQKLSQNQFTQITAAEQAVALDIGNLADYEEYTDFNDIDTGVGRK